MHCVARGDCRTRAQHPLRTPQRLEVAALDIELDEVHLQLTEVVIETDELHLYRRAIESYDTFMADDDVLVVGRRGEHLGALTRTNTAHLDVVEIVQLDVL